MSTLREQIVAEALTWVGTPYHHEGAVKGAGVDCAMFPVCVYQTFGMLTDFDPRPYPAEWHLHRDEERYLENLALHARKVAVPQLGDIAVFKYGRTVSHGAIVIDTTDPIEFAHSYIGEGCVTARINEKDYAERLHSFWSIIE